MSDVPMPELEEENDMDEVIWEMAAAKSKMHPVEQFSTGSRSSRRRIGAINLIGHHGS